MKFVYNWRLVRLLSFLISLVSGINIGYRCQNDQECWEGNGGQYSKCDGVAFRCLCTHNILGDEVKDDDLNCEMDTCTGKAELCPGKDAWRCDTNKEWYGTLSEKFTSLYVRDKNTSVCYDSERAINSRPRGIVIKTSGISGAELGAFTEEYIMRGSVFGPYKGIKVYDNSYNHAYSWDRILNTSYAVDARDPSLSNWLRYVNCANTTESENLYPVEYRGEVYYYAFNHILPGSELLFYYGDVYAKRLGIKFYEIPNYAFEKDGYAGGMCLKKKTDSDPQCYSSNTVCIDDICMCKDGTYLRNGSCRRGG